MGDKGLQLRELEHWGRAQLRAVADRFTYPNFELDVSLLLGEASGLTRVQLIANAEQEVSEEVAQRFRNLIARRANTEPVAYILERKEFFGREFKVNPSVLIPRPETELLVELALKRLQDNLKGQQIYLLDVGCGSGAIIVSVLEELGSLPAFPERALIKAFASDQSAAALSVARENAERYQISQKFDCSFLEGDLLTPLIKEQLIQAGEPVLILANLPYVPEGEQLMSDVRYEPQEALFAAEEGLSLIYRLIQQAIQQIPGRPLRLLLEVGPLQAGKLAQYCQGLAVQSFQAHPDLQGIERVVEIELA